MYNWKDTSRLEDELHNVKNVEFLIIATAFISFDGVRIIKDLSNEYNLSPRDIKVYLSEEFSPNEPHKILEQLKVISQVKIVTRKKLHAKVYMLITKSCNHKVVYGSSNLTKGGFENNLEFNRSEVLNDKTELISFFDYIDYKSIEVNEEVIAYYKTHAQEIKDIEKQKKHLRKVFKGLIKGNDPFDVDQYSLENYFFDFNDYETFFSRNAKLNDSEIKARRLKVQNKLIQVHKKVYTEIKKMGIECHWRKDNITSLIHPMVYNHYSVGWLGVRYGKTKKELDFFNQGAEDDYLGFQKHGCIQFCLVPQGFEINLFLSVKNDSIDRADLHQKFPMKRKEIENELEKLRGLNFIWEINNDNETHRFVFDKENINEFYDYYIKYDKEGCTSYLVLYYAPDDKRIKTLDMISKEVIEYVKKLLPLYNLLVFRIKNNI